jgi:hypothetical protein
VFSACCNVIMATGAGLDGGVYEGVGGSRAELVFCGGVLGVIEAGVFGRSASDVSVNGFDAMTCWPPSLNCEAGFSG